MFPFSIRKSSNIVPRLFRGKCLHILSKQNAFRLLEPKQHAFEGRSVQQSNSFSSKSMKVAILGAASDTGSFLSLFLKQSSLIDELAIYDNKCTYGLGMDLNNIDTKCKVSTCNTSEECLRQTLEGAKIVMIVADRIIKSDSNPAEILKDNAYGLTIWLSSIIKHCPQAMVGIVMNPINSLIPVAMEVYKKAGLYEYNRLFGVISLDCVRANTFFAEVVGVEPECVTVPVIGGGCSETCIPVFSQAKPCNKLSQQETIKLTHAVRLCDEEISRKEENMTTVSIAMAFGAARFCMSLCKALRHQSGVVECAYVRSCVIPEVTYFAGLLELGPEGIQKHLGISALNGYECRLLKKAIPSLQEAIMLGETFVLGRPSTESCGYGTGSSQQMNSSFDLPS